MWRIFWLGIVHQSLSINLDDWEKSRPDVYGTTDSILGRSNAVIKKADDYLGAKDDSAISQAIKTVSIEYNRVLVTSDEVSNTQTNERDFYKRCQLVGMAFVAGLKKLKIEMQFGS